MVFLVLGTAQAAWDLLEKRSEIYSSRPRFIVAYVSLILLLFLCLKLNSGEILSGNRRGVMLPYGEGWRRWRKVRDKYLPMYLPTYPAWREGSSLGVPCAQIGDVQGRAISRVKDHDVRNLERPEAL